MNEHPHEPHEHEHAGETPMDAGSQALGEALRASFTIVKFAMFLLVVVFLASGFFTVGPQERAVVLRFGKMVGEGQKAFLGPGLHWSLPYPIDDVQKIPVTEVQKTVSSVGWYYQTPEQQLTGQEPAARSSLDPAIEGYLVTADGNIIHVRAILSYHISDPRKYLFNFTNAAVVVQNSLDNALVASAAQFKVDDILGRNLAGFRDEILRRVTAMLEDRQVGVTVENCELERSAPLYLKADFQSVTTAELNRTKMLDDARKEANDILAKAVGDAATRLGAAQGESSGLVSSIGGFADKFNELLPKYEHNPALFMQTIFYPRLGYALGVAQEKIYVPQRADGKSQELRLLLNREPARINPATGQ